MCGMARGIFVRRVASYVQQNSSSIEMDIVVKTDTQVTKRQITKVSVEKPSVQAYNSE